MAFDPPSGTPGPTSSNEDQHWGYVLRKLGGGVEEIELTDEHKQDCLDDTKRWYAVRIGYSKFIQLQIQPGVSDYIMDPETISVFRVWLPMFQLPSLDVDSFSYSYFTSLFGAWTSPQQAPMPYSDLLQRLQYLEMVGRLFSTDRDWVYWPEQRRLSIMPAPAAAGGIDGASPGSAIVEIGSAAVDVTQLDPMGHDFFRRKLLLEAKRTLGNIRSIYNSYPTTGGERDMNGRDLLRQAEVEEEKLNRDILNWPFGTQFVVG